MKISRRPLVQGVVECEHVIIRKGRSQLRALQQ
jgi:hypothetical protein